MLEKRNGLMAHTPFDQLCFQKAVQGFDHSSVAAWQILRFEHGISPGHECFAQEQLFAEEI